MKKLLLRTFLIILIIVISIFLYIFGQSHSVFIDNKKIEYNDKIYEAYDLIIVEYNDEVQEIKSKKRKVFYIKGPSATLKVKYNIEGVENEIIKKIKIPLNKDIIINLPLFINDVENFWEIK